MIHDNQIIFDKRIIIRDNLAVNLISFYVEDPEDISEWCHWKGKPIMFCEKTYEELKFDFGKYASAGFLTAKTSFSL